MKTKNAIIEIRFESAALAAKFGGCANAVSSSLQYFQRDIFSTTHDKVLIIFEETDTDTAIDDVDSKIAVIRCKVNLPLQISSRDDCKRILSNLAFEAIKSVSAKYSWDTDLIFDVFESAKDKDFIIEDILKGTKKQSSDRRKQAMIRYRLDEFLDFFLVVDSKDDGRKLTIPFARLPPSLFNIEVIHKMTWQSTDTIRIDHRNRKDYWIINIEDNPSLYFFFERAERGDAHGQYDLGMMYLEGKLVLPDKDSAKQWLEKSAAQGFKRAVSALSNLVGN